MWSTHILGLDLVLFVDLAPYALEVVSRLWLRSSNSPNRCKDLIYSHANLNACRVSFQILLRSSINFRRSFSIRSLMILIWILEWMMCPLSDFYACFLLLFLVLKIVFQSSHPQKPFWLTLQLHCFR